MSDEKTKSERIAALEARVAELGRRLEEALDHVAWRDDE